MTRYWTTHTPTNTESGVKHQNSDSQILTVKSVASQKKGVYYMYVYM